MHYEKKTMKYHILREYGLCLLKLDNVKYQITIGESEHELIKYLESKKLDEAIEYFFPIKSGRSYYNLALIYFVKGDINNMIKYYLMAIELNDSSAMNNLAGYYKSVKDYDNMIKYYLMAIELNFTSAMNNLAVYYGSIKDYDNMMRYYLMAIELNDVIAMNNLAVYYRSIKDYDNMIKYYHMAIDNGHINARKDLNSFLHNNDEPKYLFKSVKYLDKKNYNKYINTYALYLSIKNYGIPDIIDDCCICFENTKMVSLYCQHLVCYTCVTKINKCPLCRDKW